MSPHFYCRDTAHWLVQTGPEDYVFACEGHTTAMLKENLRDMPAVVENPVAPGPIIEEIIRFPRIVDVAPQAKGCEVRD